MGESIKDLWLRELHGRVVGLDDAINVVKAPLASNRGHGLGTRVRLDTILDSGRFEHVLFFFNALNKCPSQSSEMMRRRFFRVRSSGRVLGTRIVCPSPDLWIDFNAGKHRAWQEFLGNSHWITMQLLGQVPTKCRAVLNCQEAVAKVGNCRGSVHFFRTRPFAPTKGTRERQIDGRGLLSNGHGRLLDESLLGLMQVLLRL